MIVLLLFLGAIGAAVLLAGRRDRRLRQVLAREHPGSVVVTGALTAVDRCVAQLETARPANGRSRPHPPAG